MAVVSVANAPAVNGTGNWSYRRAMSTLSTRPVPQSVGSFGMVSWNVPAHGVFGCQGVTFVDDRSAGRRAADIHDRPTRERARLRQRRDLGRKVTGVRNDEGAGDGLADCRHVSRTVLERLRAGPDLASWACAGFQRQACRPRQRTRARERVAGTAMRWSSIPPFFTGSTSRRRVDALSARTYLALSVALQVPQLGNGTRVGRAVIRLS